MSLGVKTLQLTPTSGHVWTVSQETLTDHVLNQSSMLGGEPPAASEADRATFSGSQHFLRDSDKLGRGEQEERNCFLLICFWAVPGLLSLQGLFP